MWVFMKCKDMKKMYSLGDKCWKYSIGKSNRAEMVQADARGDDEACMRGWGGVLSAALLMVSELTMTVNKK